MKCEMKRNEEIIGTTEYIEKYFKVVKASELSTDDFFLKYIPITYEEYVFKEELIKIIKDGVKDFRAQRIDPIINDGEICYEFGKAQMIFDWRSSIWWNSKALEFLPDRGSRLGETRERVVFLGVILKYLIEEKGYRTSTAWEWICDNSSSIANYKDSVDSNNMLAPTGSNKVGDWYDLGNTWKITKNGNKGNDKFSLVGGSYEFKGYFFPLANISNICKPEEKQFNSCGWIVLDR